MQNPYDLHGDEPSLDEILEEVSSWDEGSPPAAEASSPFIPLVSPERKPAPAEEIPAQNTGEAEEAEHRPSPIGQGEETPPPAPENPKEAAAPAPVAPPPSEEDESPWLSTWANMRVEELWEELRPPGSRLPNRPSPMPEWREQQAPEEGGETREFGHLTLLPPLRPEGTEEALPEAAENAPVEPVGAAKAEEVSEEAISKESAEMEAAAEGAEEPAGEAKSEAETAPDEAAEKTAAEAAKEGPAANPPKQERTVSSEEDGRDNLVPFVSTKEPETIREALAHLRQKGKVWLRLRKDKVAEPIVKVPRPKIKLYELPELPINESLSIKELARGYNAGLSRLRVEALCALALSLLLLLGAVIGNVNLIAALTPLREGVLLGQISLGLFALLLLLSHPVLLEGIKKLVRLRPGMETLGFFAAAAALADGVSLLFFQFRDYSLPLFAPVALVLSFQMMGRYWTKNALRLTCRTAARSKDPDLLCKEPHQYNGRAVYRRRSGDAGQFAAQIQREDWAENTFRYLTPLFFLLAVAASVWATVWGGQTNLLLWSLSATLCAGATLSGCLCFGLPFHGLSLRLSKLGAALAGWAGTKSAEHGNYILLKDTDLFPPGTIGLTSFLTFNEHDGHTVVSVTASLLREAGSGLDLLFENMIRMDEGHYVTVTDLELHKDGISGRALSQTVLVGTANFMERMGVALPPGVRVATGVMTAIGGSFAGRFSLDYSMHKTSIADMDALLLNHINPVLIAVDFNLVPTILRRLFRFPWERMAFPELSQRRKIAETKAPADGQLLGVLTMEGLSALSAMIVGVHRLRRAVKGCTRFSYLGALVGIFLCAYLSMAGALTAMNALSLSIFLVLWFVPVALISGWVNQF